MQHTILNDEQLSRLLTFITESDEEFDRKYFPTDHSESASDFSDSEE